MALKGDRFVEYTDVSYFMNEAATAGGIVTISTAGSGAALDQSAALVTYAASQSGKRPVGVAMKDMVDIDLTRQHLNVYKGEVIKGGKMPIMSRGWVVTDMIIAGLTISAGDVAYLSYSGLLTNVRVNDDATPRVGNFMSRKDEDGYAKVSINLPLGV